MPNLLLGLAITKTSTFKRMTTCGTIVNPQTNTGYFKKILTIKTRFREEYHITTDPIWRPIHSNTSQVYLESAKLLHNRLHSRVVQTVDGNMLKRVWQELNFRIDI
jgi:hypothetical protein